MITHIADGMGWQTTITLVNLADKAVAYTLDFYGDDGSVQTFALVGHGNQSSLAGTIPSGGSVNIATTGSSSEVTQGWAFLDATDEVSGFAVFRNQFTKQEAVVPIESWIMPRAILAFDNTNGYFNGVALVNPNLETMQISVVFRDENGNSFATDTFSMDPNSHTSFLLADRWPATANRRGTADFKATGGQMPAFAGMGLRFNPQGAFTSVHMLSGVRMIPGMTASGF